MNKLLIIMSFFLFCCKKKEEVKPQITNQPTSTTPTVSPFANCGKDSSWTRTHPKTTSVYTFSETCTHITFVFAVTKQKVTILKPTDDANASTVTNYKNYSDFVNSTNPNKFYYSIRYSPWAKCIIYDLSEANNIGVGGSGMKMK